MSEEMAARRPGGRYVKVTIEKIRALQSQGMHAEQIGAQLGCHADTVYGRIREAHGGATRPRRKLTPEQRSAITRRRESGEDPLNLSVEFGISRNHVYTLCTQQHASDKL